MKYLGNTHTKEVHDLNNEQTTCHIGDMKSEHRKYFDPDTISQAHSEGYNDCGHCLD